MTLHNGSLNQMIENYIMLLSKGIAPLLIYTSDGLQ